MKAEDGMLITGSQQEKYAVRLVGGSDAHTLEELGGTVTVFEDPIRCKEEFIQALKTGRYRPDSNIC